MLQNGNTLAHKVGIEDAKIVIKSILPSRIFCLVLANIFSKILYRIDFQKNKIKTQSNKRDLNFNFFSLPNCQSNFFLVELPTNSGC